MPYVPSRAALRRSSLTPAPEGITECSTLLNVPKVRLPYLGSVSASALPGMHPPPLTASSVVSFTISAFLYCVTQLCSYEAC